MSQKNIEPNTTQLEALRRMRSGNARLVWNLGGYWTTSDMVARPELGPVAFDWCVYYPTVAALERRGLIVRSMESEDEMTDPRRLVEPLSAASYQPFVLSESGARRMAEVLDPANSVGKPTRPSRACGTISASEFRRRRAAGRTTP